MLKVKFNSSQLKTSINIEAQFMVLAPPQEAAENEGLAVSRARLNSHLAHQERELPQPLAEEEVELLFGSEGWNGPRGKLGVMRN